MADGAFEDEDTETVGFGNGMDITFMSNAEAAILLENLVSTKQARPTECVRRTYLDAIDAIEHVTLQLPCRVFSKSLSYAAANMGAVQIRDVAAIDELFNALRVMEFDRVNDTDGTVSKKKLSDFEVRMRL
jgi:hypothetical protein